MSRPFRNTVLDIHDPLAIKYVGSRSKAIRYLGTGKVEGRGVSKDSVAAFVEERGVTCVTGYLDNQPYGVWMSTPVFILKETISSTLHGTSCTLWPRLVEKKRGLSCLLHVMRTDV